MIISLSAQLYIYKHGGIKLKGMVDYQGEGDWAWLLSGREMLLLVEEQANRKLLHTRHSIPSNIIHFCIQNPTPQGKTTQYIPGKVL